MKQQRQSEWPVWLIAAIVVLFLTLLALYLLNPARLGVFGFLGTPLHSPLQADYSADPRGFFVPPMQFALVEQAQVERAQQGGGQARKPTEVGWLLTPVPSITPFATLRPGETRSFTPTLNIFAPTLTPLLSGATPTLTPTLAGSVTASFMPSLTLSPTRTVTLGPGTPSTTPVRWTATPTWTPSATYTLPPGVTPSATLAATMILPATPTPGITFTSTASFTPPIIPTNTATVTNTPVPPPTRTFTPIPPTGYPPPATSTPGITPYP